MNGVTAGNIGPLPFLIPTSGRRSCCKVGQLLAGLICGLTLGSTPAQLWRTVPRPRSTPYRRTCSGPSCSSGCSCHARLDTLGRNRPSCTRSGRVKKRATPIERVVGRIFREAGASVRQNVFLKDMNVQVAAEDARRIEVLAQDLPCHGGAHLAIDVTLRGVVTAQGEAQPHAADRDGIVLEQARRENENTYPELVGSGRCKLVVLAIETGGRWSAEAVQALRQLSCAKAREAPSFMRVPVALMWERRWRVQHHLQLRWSTLRAV